MDRGSRLVRATWVVGLVSLVLFAAATPARAAFPGRNGLFVVQPATGRGLILVGADGAHPRQICRVEARCDGAQDPVWSPDGSEIAYGWPDPNGFGSLVPNVIYPDGSCLACSVPAWSGEGVWDPNIGPGFLPDGRLAVWTGDISFLSLPPQLGAVSTDGIGFQPFAVSGSWRQPAWSPTGRLAAVRRVGGKPEVFVIDPRTGSARQLTRDGASSPTWSPDGRRLAVVHRGWIELIASGGGRVRRITRGAAPAWAPSGKELAFVGAHQRLFVIAARGGRPRPVGHIRATRVDWQPVTARPLRCQAPAGSSVAAASPDATVTVDSAPSIFGPADNGAFTVLGCLTSNGRERLLESVGQSNPRASEFGLGQVVVGGDYAAVVNETSHSYPIADYGAAVAVYDLRTGNGVANRGGETVGCAGGCGLDELVLGPDADTAAHTFATNCVYQPPTYQSSSCTTLEQIVAVDSTGTHTLDSITTTGRYNPTTPSLSQLALSGDTLTWSHAGSAQSSQLN